ncbi:hypothetical protein [Coprobacter tertius]|uniref:Uncharacterized protein n=1 Tax=Coprobacter tertius TaxID=2944915 RepID=A0ABT1MKB2_9BACT|nr:hypothetical protein [Coprobacter tertius]MCP9612296.1 hypothetical protein [Coprobacter tertius]
MVAIKRIVHYALSHLSIEITDRRIHCPFIEFYHFSDLQTEIAEQNIGNIFR